MTFPKGPLVFHGLAIIAGVAGAFLTTQPIKDASDPPGSIAEDGSIESREPDLLEIARSAQPADFSDVLTTLLPDHNPENYRAAREASGLLTRRWIEHDPDDLIAFLSSNPRDNRRSTIVHTWIAHDAVAALTAFRRIEDRSARESSLNTVFSWLSEEDPETFFEFFDPESVAEFAHTLAVQNLARLDPERALSRLEGLKEDHQRASAIGAIAKSWARKDPDAALAWAETLESPDFRLGALRVIVFAVVRTDLAAARSIIDAFGVGTKERQGAGIYDEITEFLAGTDARRAGEWVSQGVPKHLQATAARTLMQEIDNARLAIEVLDTLPPGPARASAAAERFENWKHGDPETARDWILENLKGDAQKASLDNLAQSIGKSNFEKAWSFAESLEPSPLQERFRNQIVAGLAGFDLDRAREIARDISDPDLQDDVVASALRARAGRASSEEIAGWFSELPPDYPFKFLDLYWSSFYWARKDREASLAWAQSLPPGSKNRVNSYRGIAYGWSSEDRDEAFERFAAEPPGPAKDGAFALMGDNLLKSNPPKAFAAGLQIGNQGIRDDHLILSVKAWMKRDPDAAWNAVESSNLNAAAKERLFRQFQFE